MLLLLDARVPGPARERLIVAHYRHKGESPAVPIVELAKLCRDTGFRAGEPAGKRPPAYPEEYFRRCPVPKDVVAMLLARLRSDDVYNQMRVYPLPEHQSFALAQQASMLYVVLFFSPRTLAEEKKEMREIVDKHFSDNWVVRGARGRRAAAASCARPLAPPPASRAPARRCPCTWARWWT
jgi:WASH complex subunit strumpellin